MHIFLDESGDLGFDFNKKGTSRYFVITVLVAISLDAVVFSVKRTIKSKLRQKKKVRHIDELKGSSTTLSIKNYFYRQISKNDNWHINTIILDKKALMFHLSIQANIHQLYNLLAQKILCVVHIPVNEAIVHLHVDRSKELKEINIFDSCIRSCWEIMMPINCTLNIEHLRSETDPGLQAVDLFCYGIARRYERGDTAWYDVFQDRIKREIIFEP